MSNIDLLQLIREKSKFVLSYNHKKVLTYERLLISGDLAKTHYDYGVGAYILSITVRESLSTPNIWYIQTYFGTIDDGDFGSENVVDSMDKAIDLQKKIMEKFNDISVCPSQDELNVIFRDIGVYFTFL